MKDRFFDILAELCEDDVVKGNPDVELFKTGLLDSVALIELIVRLEDEYGIQIATTEFDREVVNTPNKLYGFIAVLVGTESSSGVTQA